MNNNPYAPSASSLAGPGRKDGIDAYRDLGGLSGWLSILLLVSVGMSFLEMASSALEINQGAGPATNELSTTDLLEGVVGLVQAVLYIVTAVIFLRWIYRAHKNLPELGAPSGLHALLGSGLLLRSDYQPLGPFSGHARPREGEPQPDDSA